MFVYKFEVTFNGFSYIEFDQTLDILQKMKSLFLLLTVASCTAAVTVDTAERAMPMSIQTQDGFSKQATPVQIRSK